MCGRVRGTSFCLDGLLTLLHTRREGPNQGTVGDDLSHQACWLRVGGGGLGLISHVVVHMRSVVCTRLRAACSQQDASKVGILLEYLMVGKQQGEPGYTAHA